MPSTLDDLVREVFGLDFAPWRALGFDFPEYTPFTREEGGCAVANVSASPMQLTVGGQDVTAVQVGTVCAAPSHRGRGLVRSLMERAHAHHEGRCAFFYLFANASVPAFYQRFGYRPLPQHRFSCPAPPFRATGGRARRLSVVNRDDLLRMRRTADERAPVSLRLGVRAQAWIWLFHARLLHADHLAWLEPLDVIAVSRRDRGTLHLYDLVGPEVPTLAEVYPYLGDPTCREVRFHFTPDRLRVPGLVASPAEDLPVFVRGELPDPGGPFLFPATAEA